MQDVLEYRCSFDISYFIPIQPNIHDKLVIFNEDSGINVRKSAQPDLRVPKNPVRKLKKE